MPRRCGQGELIIAKQRNGPVRRSGSRGKPNRSRSLICGRQPMAVEVPTAKPLPVNSEG